MFHVNESTSTRTSLGMYIQRRTEVQQILLKICMCGMKIQYNTIQYNTIQYNTSS